MYGQYFSLGQDPYSIKWQQINTEHFKLIFPDSFKIESNRIANYLEISYKRVNGSMHSKPGRIPLIIHNHGVISNASASWAPKRMEFFTTQPQDMYAQDWMEQLVLHEMRHEFQISRIQVGLGKVLPWFFGEQVTAGIIGLYVPSWLLEGDAVISETALSRSGRGRVPAFEMELRTQLVEKGAFSYDKAVFGSYIDYVPNQYVLGYHLTAMGRKNYGTEMWSRVLDEVGRKPYIITPFSRGIRKVSGMGKSGFYKESMSELKKIYLTTKKPNYEFCEGPYTSYRFPFYVNDSTIFALKSGINDVDKFILISKGKEQIIYTPGQLLSDAVTVHQNKIYWAEIQDDIRWEQRSYSVIKVYDITAKKLQTLTKKSRYFAPSVSRDGNRICATEVKPDYTNNLVILDAINGKLVKTIHLPENQFIQTPIFNESGDYILATIVGKDGKSIGLIDIMKATVKYLLPFSNYEISRPVMKGKYVFFIVGYGGINNIMSQYLDDSSLLQVTKSNYGVGDFSFDPITGNIIYSDYSAEGYRIKSTTFEPKKWQAPLSYTYSVSGLDTIISKQENDLIFNNLNTGLTNKKQTDSLYSTRKFRKLLNLFKVHSWGPLYIDADNQTFNPGISIMSQDLLSTSFLSMGYEYLKSEEVGRYHVKYSYQGFFPNLDISYESGDRAGTYYSKADKVNKRFTWQEQTLKTGITVPLNFSRNHIYQGVQFALNSTYFKTSLNGIHQSNFFEGNFRSMDYRIYAYKYLKSPEKNMYPRFGTTVDLQYKNTPFSGTNLGTIFFAGTQIFLPGIMKHHGGRIIVSYQVRNPNQYTFSDLSKVAPGYSGYTGNVFKLIYTDYKFPFWYPDFSIPSLLYLKRLSGKCFYSVSESDRFGIPQHYSSAGIEIDAEIHLFRFYAPIDLGVRCIYQPDLNHWLTDIVYQVNFDRFMGKDKFRKYQHCKM